MAFNGKYVKLSSIIEKVYRDNGYDMEISWADVAEWAAEAMDLIGVPQILVDKYAKIPIEMYRGELPCDFHTLIPNTVLNADTKIPLRASTNSTHLLARYEELAKLNPYGGDSILGSTIVPDTGTFQIDKNGYPVLPDDIDYLRAKDSNKYMYTRPTAQGIEEQETYTINSNYIFPSFQEGNILLFYKAFPIDDEGLPLIPENTRYIKAVACYITERIDFRLWRTNRINENIYRQSEREWMWYVGSAHNSIHIMSIDQAESFKNQITRLIPKINEHYDTFQYMGYPEKLHNKTAI